MFQTRYRRSPAKTATFQNCDIKDNTVLKHHALSSTTRLTGADWKQTSDRCGVVFGLCGIVLHLPDLIGV